MPRLDRVLLSPLLAVLLCVPAAASPVVNVAQWTDGELERWKVEQFSGDTRYRIASAGEQRWLRAEANGTASGLFLERRIDLKKTPWLSWSWRVNEPLAGLDERSKSGDDYAARLYVVVSGGAFFWRTRALNYVWSGSQAAGEAWPNAYTSNARMLALRGKGEKPGQWVSEKRNVLLDLREAFGEDIASIDAIAIMTDADNSKRKASADYGAIRFTAQ